MWERCQREWLPWGRFSPLTVRPRGGGGSTMCAVLCTVHWCQLVLFWAHNEIFLEQTIDSLYSAVHCSILQQISDLRWGERDSWLSLWELREVSWRSDFPCRCDPTVSCQERSGIQHPLWRPLKHCKHHQYSLRRRLARIMFVKLHVMFVAC